MPTTTPAKTKVITGRARLSYVHVFEAFSNNENEPKFSTVLLIPKTDTETYNKLLAAEAAAKELGKSSRWGGVIPKGLKSIIHDGDDEDKYDHDKNPEYAGNWVLSVSSKTAPGVVDRRGKEITDSREVYSGCYARASINAFPYSANGNKGVSFGLNHIQKLADGDALGGRSRAEDDFDALEDDDTDAADLL